MNKKQALWLVGASDASLLPLDWLQRINRVSNLANQEKGCQLLIVAQEKLAPATFSRRFPVGSSGKVRAAPGGVRQYPAVLRRAGSSEAHVHGGSRMTCFLASLHPRSASVCFYPHVAKVNFSIKIIPLVKSSNKLALLKNGS